MPIRKYKPTSPGRRSMSVSTFEEITKKKPEKNLIEPLKRKAGPQQPRPHHDASPGGGAKRFYRIIDFKRNKHRHSGPRGSDRIRSKPVGTHRAALLCRRREAIHSGAARPEGRRHGRVWTGSADSRRQCAAAAEHPDWYADPQHRASPGNGGQLVRSAGTSAQLMAKVGRLRAGAHAIRRSSPGASRLHGDTRPGRQRRPREHRDRQGRSEPAHGQAARPFAVR